ncbi:MAG TPA: PDZ domain-containing protein [Actinomycetota bacterium]
MSDPPGTKPVAGFHPWRYVIAGVVLIVLVIAAFFVTLPMYYIYLPGPARDVETLVEIEGAKSYSSEGSLFLTTVTIDTTVTFVDLVKAGFDSQKAVVDSAAVNQGGSVKELKDQQQVEMSQSKLAARVVALGALGLGTPTGDGAEVLETLQGGPAEGVLQPGDTIVELQGQDVQTTCDVSSIMRTVQPGEEVALTVERDGKRTKLEAIETVENDQDGSALIGIRMRDLNFEFQPDVHARFRTGRIGGPSAGLMFALGLYDRLTPDDLTGGRRIAGTGTIRCDGSVGPIGGVEEKIAGAEREGAELFLSPIADADAAKRVATDLEVVPVATFDDAVEYLESQE